jgi:hypothetical protein
VQLKPVAEKGGIPVSKNAGLRRPRKAFTSCIPGAGLRSTGLLFSSDKDELLNEGAPSFMVKNRYGLDGTARQFKT